MQRILRYLGAILMLSGFWLGTSPAAAQRSSMLAPKARPPRQSGKEIVRHPFDSTDMVEGYVEMMKKDLGTSASHYFVGEPIIVPLVLANHTRFPITLLTNFNPRSQLTVMIRPEGQPQFRYNGPYMPGYYAPVGVKLLPLEEFHNYLMIWSDIQAPDGLAISKPGNYTLEITILVGVEESGGGTRELKPHRGVFSIVVDPTPKELEPLVDLIRQKTPSPPGSSEPPLPNSVYLQLHKNPLGWMTRTADIANQFPNTIFTPYLWYGLASYYATLYTQKPAGDLYSNALQCYQYAKMPYSPFMEEIYFDLLTFLDARDQAKIATGVGRELLQRIEQVAPWRMGRIGNDTMLQKYLVDTQELDPAQHWAFLP